MPEDENTQPPVDTVANEADAETHVPPPAFESQHPVAAMINAYGSATEAPRAAYTVEGYFPKKNVIVIADGWAEGSGRRSVTNDAEHVVASINAARAGVRVIYKDTEGDYAEIYHDRGSFRGYQPIQDLDAYIKDM